ncbi:MAG: GspE/PulE family protein [Fusobacteria bacterium]|nr:GspE/PulE family protein [Fusobacteriota bacterium]
MSLTKKELYEQKYFKKHSNIDILKEFLNKAGKFSDELKKEEHFEELLKIVKSKKSLKNEQVQEVYAQIWNIPYISLGTLEYSDSEIELMKKFDTNFIREHEFLLAVEGVKTRAYSTRPLSDTTKEILSSALAIHLDYFIILSESFEENFNRYLNQIQLTKGIAEQLAEISSDGQTSEISDLKNENNPIVKFVNTLLYDSLRKGASDIHIEMYHSGLKTKYRIDGVLIEELSNIEPFYHKMIISRIKILGNLNIAEQRLPQDGRFMQNIEGRAVDFRISIIPTNYGESAVIRILDKKTSKLTLELLGASKREKEILINNGKLPHGVVLVTGPTGSGKTTTLYSLISEIKKKEEKLITIEDPVEYELDDVVQIPVNEKTGLTFAKGLRAVLRQDPDRIMVGEIRDRETAEIAIQAALTGHLVFTTLHANSSIEVIGRLINLGVDPYQFSTALNLIISQRLMRVYCHHCGGSGCSKCEYTGFKGRKAVFELLEFDSELKELIIMGKSPIAIRELAIKNGMKSIDENARERVLNKETSIEEFERVIGKWN